MAGAGREVNAIAPNNGRTPLHIAMLSGEADAAAALIIAKSDVNIPDLKGGFPLHSVIKGGHTTIALNLLMNGARHDDLRGSKGTRSVMGDSPIHLAARRGLNEVLLSCPSNGRTWTASTPQRGLR